jgi:hypothetical protein
MTLLNLNNSLNKETIADILVYLEKRPLGEVYELFQKIVAQLTTEEPNGRITERHESNNLASSGSGNANGGGSGVSTLPAEPGSG